MFNTQQFTKFNSSNPKAQILVASLALIDIPAHAVANDKELLFELVLKNLYILRNSSISVVLVMG
jgi:hypothetical protein